MRHIALGSQSAVDEALDVFRGEGGEKHQRKIRLIGPIAVRATGPKTFTLVGEEPIHLEELVVDGENTVGVKQLVSAFSKRPSLQFDEATEVSASFPQVISLIAVTTV